jgi:hypothetical protein
MRSWQSRSGRSGMCDSSGEEGQEHLRGKQRAGPQCNRQLCSCPWPHENERRGRFAHANNSVLPASPSRGLVRPRDEELARELASGDGARVAAACDAAAELFRAEWGLDAAAVESIRRTKSPEKKASMLAGAIHRLVTGSRRCGRPAWHA